MENQQQTTTLCRAGCGFFGSSATDGLCSKCYRDQLKRKQDTSARLSPTISQASVVTTSTAVSACTADSIGATTSAAMIAEKLREVSCSQAAKSSEDVTAQLESVAAAAEASGILASSSSGALSTSSSVASLDAAAISDSSLNIESQAIPKKSNRCHVCKKRVGLTGFACRCGGLYCGEHRYDTAHGCSFDYKTMEREEIRKNNPVIVSEKIQRL